MEFYRREVLVRTLCVCWPLKLLLNEQLADNTTPVLTRITIGNGEREGKGNRRSAKAKIPVYKFVDEIMFYIILHQHNYSQKL